MMAADNTISPSGKNLCFNRTLPRGQVTVRAQKGQQHPIEKSRQLQRRLYPAAKKRRKQEVQELERRRQKVVGKPMRENLTYGLKRPGLEAWYRP